MERGHRCNICWRINHINLRRNMSERECAWGKRIVSEWNIRVTRHWTLSLEMDGSEKAPRYDQSTASSSDVLVEKHVFSPVGAVLVPPAWNQRRKRLHKEAYLCRFLVWCWMKSLGSSFLLLSPPPLRSLHRSLAPKDLEAPTIEGASAVKGPWLPWVTKRRWMKKKRRAQTSLGFNTIHKILQTLREQALTSSEWQAQASSMQNSQCSWFSSPPNDDTQVKVQKKWSNGSSFSLGPCPGDVQVKKSPLACDAGGVFPRAWSAHWLSWDSILSHSRLEVHGDRSSPCLEIPHSHFVEGGGMGGQADGGNNWLSPFFFFKVECHFDFRDRKESPLYFLFLPVQICFLILSNLLQLLFNPLIEKESSQPALVHIIFMFSLIVRSNASPSELPTLLENHTLRQDTLQEQRTVIHLWKHLKESFLFLFWHGWL